MSKLQTKSRFRLTLELYAWGFLALLGGCFLPLGILLLAPAILVLQPLLRELRTRREPLTSKQKHTLFALQSSFSGSAILALLVLALLREKPLAWIVFALISLLMLASLFYGYEQIYKDKPMA
jgi:hypothetical protein